jgi:hypothetical protein
MRVRSILSDSEHVIPLDLSLAYGDGGVCRAITLQIACLFREEAGLNRVAHEFGDRVQVELVHQSAPVCFDCFWADIEPARDHLVT